MLRIIHNVRQMRFGEMIRVYLCSIEESGKLYYPYLSEAEQKLQAENDLLEYVETMFRTDDMAFCAAWAPDGQYKAMLRMEKYHDGFLLTSLETAPEARGKGYASKLVSAVLEWVGDKRVYAHINRNNSASIAVHEKCGFRKILDHAVYLDGSVIRSDATYLFDPAK